MKKIIIIFFILISSQVYSYEVPLTIQWDADTNENWSEVRIYSRKAEESYNYELPVEIIPQTYENGLSKPNQLTRAWTFEDNKESTIYWVARAIDNDGNQSENSNEIDLTINLSPLEKVLINFELKKEEGILKLNWTNEDKRIKEYKLLFSENLDGPYETELASIANNEETSKEINIPIDGVFPAGELSTRFFMVKAYADFGLQSESQERIEISIDRRTLQKVFNLRINFIQEEENENP